MYMRKPSKSGEEWEWTMERIICTLLRYALTDDSCQMIIISKYSFTSSNLLPHTVLIIIILGLRQDMPSLYCPSYVKRAFHFNYSTWIIFISGRDSFISLVFVSSPPMATLSLPLSFVARSNHIITRSFGQELFIPAIQTFPISTIVSSTVPNHPQRNLTSRTYNLVHYTLDGKVWNGYHIIDSDSPGSCLWTHNSSHRSRWAPAEYGRAVIKNR